MLLQIRPMAVRCAVLCFFAIGIVGSLGGLSPYTCCKRAVLGGRDCLSCGGRRRACRQCDSDPGDDRRPDP